MRKKITIAIDGYSSTGKSTIAKELANRLGYVYVDTGGDVPHGFSFRNAQ